MRSLTCQHALWSDRVLGLRAQWQRLRAEQEQRELDGCTFAPRLSARAPQGPYTPLPQRVRELQRVKRRAPRLRCWA